MSKIIAAPTAHSIVGREPPPDLVQIMTNAVAYQTDRQNYESLLFVSHWYKRWRHHNISMHMSQEFFTHIKLLCGLRFITYNSLNSQGWIIANPYRNAARLTAKAIVGVRENSSMLDNANNYFTPPLIDTGTQDA